MAPDLCRSAAMGASLGHAGSFVNAVSAFADRHGLLAPGGGVLAGVSGGADSVVMLDVLDRLAPRPERGWTIAVGHLNHCLRADADEDEQFVRRLAESRGLECVRGRTDVSAEARRRGVSVETAARDARYGFLAEAARRVGAGRIALAHHADDQAETVLFRMLRGTHLRGLAGMAPRRELDGGLAVIRPLLGVRRVEILAYGKARGLLWREDPTNAETKYRRNFIRHELLPAIRREINPSADEALLRLAAAAGEAEEHLLATCRKLLAAAVTERAVDELSLDADRLAAEAPVLRRVALRTVLEETGVPMRDVSARRLAEADALLETPSGAVSLPGGWELRRRRGALTLRRVGDAESPWRPVPLAVGAESRLPDGRVIVCEELPFEAGAFAGHCRGGDRTVEWLDADAVRGALLARPRRDGDSFVPLGAPGRQAAADLLTNEKLSPARKRRAVCICDEGGIVWLAPLRIAERAKVTGATRRVLKLSLVAAGDGRAS